MLALAITPWLYVSVHFVTMLSTSSSVGCRPLLDPWSLVISAVTFSKHCIKPVTPSGMLWTLPWPCANPRAWASMHLKIAVVKSARPRNPFEAKSSSLSLKLLTDVNLKLPSQAWSTLYRCRYDNSSNSVKSLYVARGEEAVCICICCNVGMSMFSTYFVSDCSMHNSFRISGL